VGFYQIEIKQWCAHWEHVLIPSGICNSVQFKQPNSTMG